MKALSQATLVELACAGAVRGDTLHGRADGYVLSVQYGLHEAVLTAKRGGARRFARVDTALALLRTLRAAAAAPPTWPRWTAYTPTPPRPHRPPRAPGRPAAPSPELAAMPLSIRRARARAAALLDALEVGETWDASDAERAFNFERHWAVLVARPPRVLRGHLLDLGRQVAEASLLHQVRASMPGGRRWKLADVQSQDPPVSPSGTLRADRRLRCWTIREPRIAMSMASRRFSPSWRHRNQPPYWPPTPDRGRRTARCSLETTSRWHAWPRCSWLF